MRVVLFRGKRTDNNEWVYGSPLFQDGYVLIRFWNSEEFEWEEHLVIPETVGQLTGLADKNYTNIFEGDIISVGCNKRLMYVQFNEESLTWELTDVGVSACEVNHLDNTFDLGEIQVEAAYGEMVSEVIGNIHDNPELWNRRTNDEFHKKMADETL